MNESDSQSYQESWISRGIGILLVLALGFLWQYRYAFDNDKYYADPYPNSQELLNRSEEIRRMLEALRKDEETVRSADDLSVR